MHSAHPVMVIAVSGKEMSNTHGGRVFWQMNIIRIQYCIWIWIVAIFNSWVVSTRHWKTQILNRKRREEEKKLVNWFNRVVWTKLYDTMSDIWNNEQPWMNESLILIREEKEKVEVS